MKVELLDKAQLDSLKLDISIRAKNGIDFILSAAAIWSLIAYVWTLSFTAYDKSILTFIISSLLLPLALLLSKLLKTEWKMLDNPLQKLGLWLNFAQLFYFPFLIFILLTNPDYFLMAYIIITGAHFFPYSWYYNEIAYAIIAAIISFGSLLIALNLEPNSMHLVAIFIVVCLLILAILLRVSHKKKRSQVTSKPVEI